MTRIDPLLLFDPSAAERQVIKYCGRCSRLLIGKSSAEAAGGAALNVGLQCVEQRTFARVSIINVRFFSAIRLDPTRTGPSAL